MFSSFFMGLQQDLKLVLVAPFVCALFRLAFILIYRPKKSPAGEWWKWFQCFRYGFWWGMDFHAYVFVFSMVLVSLPGAFLPFTVFCQGKAFEKIVDKSSNFDTI